MSEVVSFRPDLQKCIESYSEMIDSFAGLPEEMLVSGALDYARTLGKQFRLSDLAEIRCFLSALDNHGEMAVIPDSVWNDAKEKLFSQYARSTCLEVCSNLIKDFETVYPDRYRTDLDEFIRESQYEDFYHNDCETLYISTIHKAKGREFDAVYMLLQNCVTNTDEKRRTVYVGITRAKESLYIHSNTDLFNNYSLPGLSHRGDPAPYAGPDELLIQLTHKDVYLDYFKSRQDLILRLRSGMSLIVRDGCLWVRSKSGQLPVACLSKGFKEQLSRWASKGYSPVSSTIQFIVAWKGENDENETFIVFPSIKLKKAQKNAKTQ